MRALPTVVVVAALAPATLVRGSFDWGSMMQEASSAADSAKQAAASVTAQASSAASGVMGNVGGTSSQLFGGFSGLIPGGSSVKSSASTASTVPGSTAGQPAIPAHTGFKATFCMNYPDTPLLCKSMMDIAKETISEPKICNESNPSCCMESSCLSVPGPLSCNENRGSTMCIGDGVDFNTSIFVKKGKCMCVVGACNADGRCVDAPSPVVASDGAAVAPTVRSPAAAVPTFPAPAPAPVPPSTAALQAALSQLPTYQAFSSEANTGILPSAQLQRLFSIANGIAPVTGHKVPDENIDGAVAVLSFLLVAMVVGAGAFGVHLIRRGASALSRAVAARRAPSGGVCSATAAAEARTDIEEQSRALLEAVADPPSSIGSMR